MVGTPYRHKVVNQLSVHVCGASDGWHMGVMPPRRKWRLRNLMGSNGNVHKLHKEINTTGEFQWWRGSSEGSVVVSVSVHTAI